MLHKDGELIWPLCKNQLLLDKGHSHPEVILQEGSQSNKYSCFLSSSLFSIHCDVPLTKLNLNPEDKVFALSISELSVKLKRDSKQSSFLTISLHSFPLPGYFKKYKPPTKISNHTKYHQLFLWTK